MLTNGTSRLATDLTALGIESRFFKIFNSAVIGVCKPDRKIFAHVVENLGCAPSEIFFVDDSMSHVQAAQEMGMAVHHYQSPDDFQTFCQQMQS